MVNEHAEHDARDQRLGEVAGRPAAELYLLLARCYFDLGRFDDAARQRQIIG